MNRWGKLSREISCANKRHGNPKAEMHTIKIINSLNGFNTRLELAEKWLEDNLIAIQSEEQREKTEEK